MAWLRRDNNASIMPRVASCDSSGGPARPRLRSGSAVLLLEPLQDLRPGAWPGCGSWLDRQVQVFGLIVVGRAMLLQDLIR